MRLRKLIKLGSKGDTIIEILLSIAVLSLVLSVSYGLANRSSQASRQAQERGEAQKLAEEQLELLRGYFTPDQPWEGNLCFREDNPSTPANEAVPTSNQDHCNNRGSAERYNLRVIPSGENTFTVDVEWQNVKGDVDELSLSYKIPVTGDIFATAHAECADGIDNPGPDNLRDANDPDCHTDGNVNNDASYDSTIDDEDPEVQCNNGVDDDLDGRTDLADPGCDNASDDDEFNLPLEAFQTIGGTGYHNCEVSGESDYCQHEDSAVYALSTLHPSNSNPAFRVTYRFTSDQIGREFTSGQYRLIIRYYNKSFNNLDPEEGYSYDITVQYSGNSKPATLPIENTQASRNPRNYTVENLNINNPRDITIQWNNDSYSGFNGGNPNLFDSNFAIVSVKLEKVVN